MDQTVTTLVDMISWQRDEQIIKQEGFLQCQTPTSTVRLNVEEWSTIGVQLTVNNGGCRMRSE